MRLSKSQYIRGLQCHKSLWLYRHRRDLMTETPPSLQFTFDQGRLIGELAWRRFSGGRLIKEDHLHAAEALKATAAAADEGQSVIYEAAAIYDRVLIRADILVRRGKLWDLIEVKGAAGVKEVNLDDVAVQKYVLDGAGFSIRKCFVMHVNNQYTRQGEIDAAKFFTLADVGEEAALMQKEIPKRVARMLEVLNLKNAPEIDIGPHCSAPYDCAFMDHCWKDIPDYSVFDLVRIKNEKALALRKKGVLLIRDIPEDFPLSASQKLQVEVEKSGRPRIDRQAIAEILKKPVYPLHFLDFETISPAIPPYDGIRPFQQIPFQASLHIQKVKGGPVESREYLGDAKSDPRPGLVDFLVKSIAPQGSVVAYNASFEGSRIAELADTYPRSAKSLRAIKDRLWDIAIPFRSGFYVHPKFKGRWSIKAVLPALVPEMSYEGMIIGNGQDASSAYLNLMEGKLSQTETKNTISALKKYWPFSGLNPATISD